MPLKRPRASLSVTKLYAPETFWKSGYVNRGCGPGPTGDKFVPDRIWGVDVGICCAIHDWMYLIGESITDKAVADRTLLNNMLRLISDHGGPAWKQKIRRWLAWQYFKAVDRFGGPAFWNAKNKSSEMQEA